MLGRFTVGIMVAAMLSAGAAGGQELEKAKACAASDDGNERLLCYDAIFRLDIKPTAAPEPPANKGKWQGRTEKNKLTDKTDVFVSVNSNEPVPARFGGDGALATLMLRCRDNTTSMTVWFGGQFMASSGGFDRVTYRIDDAPAKDDRWEESTNNEHMGLWNGGRSIPLIKALFDHKTFLLQATPFNESSITLSFDIAGVEQAVTELRAACGW